MRRVSTNFLVPPLPVLADTDAETSIDLDKSVGALQETKKPNFTKSVYEITMDDLEGHHASNEMNAFEEKLRREIKDWKEHITKALSDLKEAKKEHPVIDWSILPNEKREFVERAPDLSRFLRRTQEFRCAAIKFIENDYAEILTLQDNISSVCKEQLNVCKESFLEKQLANGEECG